MINGRCISGEIQALIKYTSFNGNVRTYPLKGHSSNKCLNNKDLCILEIFLLHFSDCNVFYRTQDDAGRRSTFFILLSFRKITIRTIRKALKYTSMLYYIPIGMKNKFF